VIIAAGVMIFVAGSVSHFVERHPTVKMLALSFLLLIGFTLVAGAFKVEIPKGYIYFAMGFSVLVEMLNLRVRSQVRPVNLREPYAAEKRLELQPVMVEASAPVVKAARKSAPKVKSKAAVKSKRKK